MTLEIRFLSKGKVHLEDTDAGVDVVLGEVNGRWLATAKQLGMTLRELEAAVDAEREPVADLAATAAPIVLRGIADKRSDGVSYGPPSIEGLREALAAPVAQWSVIEWGDVERLCILDVDYHGRTPPENDIARRARPSPACYWRSHGGGFHLAYHAEKGFTAEELAGAAAVSIVDASPQATVELLPRTAHPGAPRERGGKLQHAGEVRWRAQELTGLLSCWRGGEYGEAAPAEIDDWLEARGMEIGQRYEHDRCPFNPHKRESGNQPPVQVKEEGVRCFTCEGTGHVSRGFATWDRLVAGLEVARLVVSARELVPWEHARHVIAGDYGDRMPESVARVAYVALCKFLHPDDPRVSRVTVPIGCVRGEGLWLSPTKLTPITPAPRASRFSQSPYCQWVANDGSIQVDSVRVDQSTTNQDLPGYHPLVPIRGLRVWGQYLPYQDGLIRAVVPGSDVVRYLPERKRLSWESCLLQLEEQFPGVDLKFLELLIVARGFAECSSGEIPTIMVTGPSGAAKTRHVELAQRILGDRMATVEDNERFDENFGSAIAGGHGFILLDEYAKDLGDKATRKRFNRLLPMGREMRVRVLYMGWLEMRVRSVLVVANISYGAAVLENAQLGRRFIYAPLKNRVPRDWRATSGGLDTWRQRNADLADSVASHVIDRWFAPGSDLVWRDVARELGFAPLEEAVDRSEGLRVEHKVRELFHALKDAPPASKRWKGRGWKAVDLRTFDDPVTSLWYELCDDPKTPDGRGTSTLVDELDLAAALGLPPGSHVKLETSRSGLTLAMRFISSQSRVDYWVGEEIEKNLGIVAVATVE